MLLSSKPFQTLIVILLSMFHQSIVIMLFICCCSSQLMVSIKKNGDGVLVKLHELGVTVSFEGRNKLKIKVLFLTLWLMVPLSHKFPSDVSSIYLFKYFCFESSAVWKLADGLVACCIFFQHTMRRLFLFEQVSPVSMLQGRLCGLCGNNNYDIGDDLKTFEGKLTNSRSFVSDNVMQSEQCDVNDYKNHLNVRHAGSNDKVLFQV